METLVPLTSSYTVPDIPKNRPTEFEVQAALWSTLRNQGFDVRGEVKWCKERKKGQRRETCRFDVVIYEEGRAIHIVEVKSSPIRHKNGVTATRQGVRYRHFGVPVTFVYGMDDARAFVDLVVRDRRGV